MYESDGKNKLELIKSQNGYNMIKKISSLILELCNKNISVEVLQNLEDFKQEILELKKKSNTLEENVEENEGVMEMLLQRLNYFLVECLHKQTSVIIRELIKDIFKIEYKHDDFSLIDSILPLKDYPKIFKKIIYSNSSIDDMIKDLPEKELKETSDLFTTYESPYPYSSETTLKAFNSMAVSGRMKLYEGFFLWFSDYYTLYYKSLNLLMSNEDSIPITWRYYLAIMAASTLRCEYILRELEMQFLLKGGDEKWLIFGLEAVPEKLKMLERINNILAHQPWKLKVQDLKEIFRETNSNGWQKYELIHAILILTNYHRLCTIVEAMKFNVKEEDDFKNDETKIQKLKNEENNVKKIIISELEIINQSEKCGTINTHKRQPSSEDYVMSKVNTSFDSVFNGSTTDFSKHISKYCTVYLDFDSHSDEYYSCIEFNWQDHGAYILKNFHPTAVDAIDSEIEFITNITSNNIGGDTKKLDTAQFRHTISTYVEKIFGYVNESFDYSKTNKLLHRTHKQFIKNIACFPQKITKVDISVMKVTFSPEEIFQFILLVSVTKLRLQLTYFTKQFYEIIKSID